MDFLLYFQKVIWHGYDFIFGKKKSEKATHPRICPSFGGNMPEAQTDKGLLRPPPPIIA